MVFVVLEQKNVLHRSVYEFLLQINNTLVGVFLIHQSFNNIISYNKYSYIQPSTDCFLNQSNNQCTSFVFRIIYLLCLKAWNPRIKITPELAPEYCSCTHISDLSCTCPCLLPSFYFCLPTWGKAPVKNLRSLLFPFTIKEREKTQF